MYTVTCQIRNLLASTRKVFLEKKHSCDFGFQNWPTFLSVKYKTSTLSKITEAWQYSNIVLICVR